VLCFSLTSSSFFLSLSKTREIFGTTESAIRDGVSNISDTPDKINESINKFQDDNRRVLEKSEDTFRKYQNKSSIQHKKYRITP
jgi:hypothetical protein